MKKVFLIIVIIFFISVSNVYSNSCYDYLINDDSYGAYSLYVEGLNSNNFLSYFSDVNVIRIYPNINPVYKDRFGTIFYKFTSSDFSSEINSFRNQYLYLIKKKSYLDYNYLYLNGIPIGIVDVYMSGTDLYNFLSNSDLFFTVKKIADGSI